MKKTIPIVYSVIFIIFLIIPLLLFNHDPEAVSFLENKKLASKPKLMVDHELNTEYLKQLEAYIDDNIGMKQEAIQANLLILYKLFHTLDVPNYMMGKEGNIFYTNNGYAPQVWSGTIHFSEGEKQAMTDAFLNFSDWLADLDAKLIVMGIPDKENIYPEVYPDSVKRYSDITQFDDLLNYMREFEELNVLDIKSALWQAKDEGKDLYYKAFDCTHWNFWGMYVGYYNLMERLQQYDPALEIVSKEQLNITTEQTSTMEHLQKSELLSQYISFDDVKYEYNILNQRGIESDTLPGNFELEKGEIYYHYTNTELEHGKTLSIIGDSYLYGQMLPLLGESFKDVYFLQPQTGNQIKKYIQETNPDYVLYEAVERAFYYHVVLERLQEVAA